MIGRARVQDEPGSDAIHVSIDHRRMARETIVVVEDDGDFTEKADDGRLLNR